MRIIPVIDLLDGSVVHAKQGQRKHYQPIVSSLTTSSKPLDIVKAFMDIYPFDTLYIADLNAIQRLNTANGDHASIIAKIHQAIPTLSIWLDAGIRVYNDIKPWQSLHTHLVIGTENIASVAEYQAIFNTNPHQVVLSLDFMPNGYQGDETFLHTSHLWPNDVIVMTLNHVGSGLGIAKELLSQLSQQAHHHRLYAAGGVRNLADIEQLAQIGIHGALVATALHNRNIDADTLNRIKAPETEKPE